MLTMLALWVGQTARRIRLLRHAGQRVGARRVYQRNTLCFSALAWLAMSGQLIILALNGLLRMDTALPLHLCGAMGVCLYPALRTRSERLREAVFYLAPPGGMAALLFVARHKKMPPLTLMDLAAPAVMIGQIFGRWGNFFNREAFGGYTDNFLAMRLLESHLPAQTRATEAGQKLLEMAKAGGYEGYIQVHPTFLYESVWNLIGFIGLHLFSKKRKFDGEVFLLYVAWYGLGRAWIEGLRTDSLYLFSTGIRVSQLVAIVSFLAAAGILAWVLLKKKPAPDALYVNRKPAEPEAADGKDTDD